MYVNGEMSVGGVGRGVTLKYDTQDKNVIFYKPLHIAIILQMRHLSNFQFLSVCHYFCHNSFKIASHILFFACSRILYSKLFVLYFVPFTLVCIVYCDRLLG